MPTLITAPLSLDLTHAYLASLRLQPLVAGNDWELRFQVRRWARSIAGVVTNEARSLTGATIVLTLRATPSGPVIWTRTSGVVIAGTSPARQEIQVDADQVTEDTVTSTGAGWAAMKAASTTAERQPLLAAVGKPTFKLQVTLPSGDDAGLRLLASGIIEIGAP